MSTNLSMHCLGRAYNIPQRISVNVVCGLITLILTGPPFDDENVVGCHKLVHLQGYYSNTWSEVG